jgi:glucose/arabinose dehydrogenase
MHRRTLLSALAAGLAGCGLGAPRNDTTDRTIGEPTPPGPSVALVPAVVSRQDDPQLGQPTDVAVREPGEWVVATRRGVVFSYESTNGLEIALDVSDRVLTEKEQGFHGLALHPDGDRLYARYSHPPTAETPDHATHVSVLSSFQLTDDGRVRADSERVLLKVAQPGPEHNGGAVTFGPDGLLYTSFGTGEWVEYPVDEMPVGHPEDWYAYNEGSHAQVLETLHGSIVRIDVDGSGDDYRIPDDNPLVGRDGRDELYAWGFRNPWRMGFSDGRLLVGDVGEYAFEEVDVVEKGGNYGWNVYEGAACFNAQRASDPRPTCPTESPRGRQLRDPVVTYTHSVRTDSGVQKVNLAVVGGYVYEGNAVPAIDGEYVFGDYGGRLFVATPGGDRWPMRELRVANTGSGRPPGRVYGFARDAAGELLVLLAGERGGVYRLTAAETA